MLSPQGHIREAGDTLRPLLWLCDKCLFPTALHGSPGARGGYGACVRRVLKQGVSALMNPNRFALAALGFTCVAAAAGGGYLASRQSAAVQPAEAATVCSRRRRRQTRSSPCRKPKRSSATSSRPTAGRAAASIERPRRPRAQRTRRRAAAEAPSARTHAAARRPTWPVSVPSGFPTDDSSTPQAPAEPAARAIDNTRSRPLERRNRRNRSGEASSRSSSSRRTR